MKHRAPDLARYRFKNWLAMRLFDRIDAMGHKHWKVQPRSWGHQMMRCAKPGWY